jgi:hypothetical protein
MTCKEFEQRRCCYKRCSWWYISCWYMYIVLNFQDAIIYGDETVKSCLFWQQQEVRIPGGCQGYGTLDRPSNQTQHNQPRRLHSMQIYKHTTYKIYKYRWAGGGGRGGGYGPRSIYSCRAFFMISSTSSSAISARSLAALLASSLASHLTHGN